MHSVPILVIGWAPLQPNPHPILLGRCNRNWLQDWMCIQPSWYKQDRFKNCSVALKYVNKFSDGRNCNCNVFKDTARIDHTQIYSFLSQLNPAKCHPCLHSTETWSRHWSVIKTGGTFFPPTVKAWTKSKPPTHPGPMFLSSTVAACDYQWWDQIPVCHNLSVFWHKSSLRWSRALKKECSPTINRDDKGSRHRWILGINAPTGGISTLTVQQWSVWMNVAFCMRLHP